MSLKRGLKMRKTALYAGLLLFGVIVCPALSTAEDFLGVPVISEGKTLSKTKSRLEMMTPVSHDEAVGFYEKALGDLPDIRIRDWADATYIEDDSNLPWHSITISKEKREGMTHIVIVKDNWTWIIGTLVLRFIGVFVVLLCLFAGMSIYGSILSRTAKEKGGK
jgi:hypothetical protein